MSAWLATLRKPSVTNQPPTHRELVRNDWAVVILIAFALFLGVGIRNNAANASRSVNLGEGLPTVQVPSNWITSTPEGMVLQVRNPRSGSAFPTEISVDSRLLGPTDNIVTVRAGLGAQHARDLFRYRELSAEGVTVNREEGILVTYAYIADPAREQGGNAPPVVVQAQDLIFPSGNQMVIITMAADTTVWDAQTPFFDILTNSLRMREEPVVTVTDVLSNEEGGE
jgi:hypothetical protein